MAITWLTIPTFPGVPRSTQTVTLSGVAYALTLVWRDRESRWFMSLARTTGEEIVRGVKVVLKWPLLKGTATRYRPPGTIVAWANVGGPPQLHDFGTRVLLLYGVETP